MDEKNDIEVVVDNEGKDLEISPVYEHLKVAKPIPKEDKDQILIPEAISDKNNNETDNSNDTDTNNVESDSDKSSEN